MMGTKEVRVTLSSEAKKFTGHILSGSDFGTIQEVDKFAKKSKIDGAVFTKTLRVSIDPAEKWERKILVDNITKLGIWPDYVPEVAIGKMGGALGIEVVIGKGEWKGDIFYPVAKSVAYEPDAILQMGWGKRDEKSGLVLAIKPEENIPEDEKRYIVVRAGGTQVASLVRVLYHCGDGRVVHARYMGGLALRVVQIRDLEATVSNENTDSTVLKINDKTKEEIPPAATNLTEAINEKVDSGPDKVLASAKRTVFTNNKPNNRQDFSSREDRYK